MKYMMLHCFVGGEWIPVLCSSEECPGPVTIVIQELNTFDSAKWIENYALRNDAVDSRFQFQPFKSI
jgi:hypothetical protein